MRSLLALVAWLALSAFTIGQPTIFTAADSGNGNLLLAQTTPVPQAGTLTSLSFYVTTPAGQMYLAAYADAAGKPGALLATTAVFTPVVGWNTQPVVAPANLDAASTVWLAYLPSSNALAFVKATVGGGSAVISRTFGAPPAAFGAPASSTPSQWSLYATLTPVAATPVDATPGSPSVALATFGLMNFAWDAPPGVVAGYRLYVGAGASGCPGPNYVSSVAAVATVQHLAWGATQVAQVTAVDANGGESPCSNVASGQPQ